MGTRCHTAGKKSANPPSAAGAVMPASPVPETSQKVEELANPVLITGWKNSFNEFFWLHIQISYEIKLYNPNASTDERMSFFLILLTK